MSRPHRFSRPALRAFLIGLPDVLSLPLPVQPPPGVPSPALAAGPAVLLVLSAFAGAWAIRRVDIPFGPLPDGGSLRQAIRLAATLGTLSGLLLSLLDQAAVPVWRGDPALPRSVLESVSTAGLAVGVLYGGLTEEVIFRWGLLTAVAAAAARLLPMRIAVMVAVIVSAGLFALAHLPAAFAGAESWPPAAVVRILGWNALPGTLFGVLYVRRGLAAAVAAHIGFHAGSACAAVLFRFLG
jgi:membrane protease YdiL (CAAX protease family)